ncbi:MAG: prepilin-type N-terminal cleavage/methylation domain-containing protein [Burkholderiaceae bacterium]|nr:prepilin-type N-terminal cleavage/methylation domain-containing protein [Burkholderiaceae bacterium]
MNAPTRTSSVVRARQRGFTLFELVAVLALGSLLIYGGMKAKRGAEVNTNAQNLATSVQTIQVEAAKVYPGLFTGLTCVTLANNSVFSSTSFRVDRSVPATPTVFYNAEPNSQISCAAASVIIAGKDDGYTLTFPGLSNEMCNATAERLNQAAWLMSVNSTSVKTLRGALDTATKGAQCNATATNDNQTIVASFSRTLPPQ